MCIGHWTKNMPSKTEYHRAYYAKNKERIVQRQKDWYSENKARVLADQRTPEARARANANRNRPQRKEQIKSSRRRAWLKKRYGLSEADWTVLFGSQDQCCAACGSNTPQSKQDWAVDHCHKTGEVRGILCIPCNLALGMMKDDPIKIDRLAGYLRRALDKKYA